MALAKDEVIVIKGSDFSEADKILVVFGKNRGKYSLIAKGVRKIESKNRPAVQTLSRSSITFYEGRNLGVLVEAGLLHQMELDREQLMEISKTLLIMNKLLPEEEQEEEVFRRYQKLLDGNISLRDVNRFRMWVLEHLGYLPDMRSCSVCEKDDDLSGIDLVMMEVICTKCRKLKKGKFKDISGIKYEGSEMDEALDRYINGVIEA